MQARTEKARVIREGRTVVVSAANSVALANISRARPQRPQQHKQHHGCGHPLNVVVVSAAKSAALATVLVLVPSGPTAPATHQQRRGPGEWEAQPPGWAEEGAERGGDAAGRAEERWRAARPPTVRNKLNSCSCQLKLESADYQVK
uniref:Uncharacterized protein n=1 Tax=Oryza brachyantha TaxID=4533 RepID=J3N7F2_ORYBR